VTAHQVSGKSQPDWVLSPHPINVGYNLQEVKRESIPPPQEKEAGTTRLREALAGLRHPQQRAGRSGGLSSPPSGLRPNGFSRRSGRSDYASSCAYTFASLSLVPTAKVLACPQRVFTARCGRAFRGLLHPTPRPSSRFASPRTPTSPSADVMLNYPRTRRMRISKTARQEKGRKSPPEKLNWLINNLDNLSQRKQYEQCQSHLWNNNVS
jgi:hypothetical protein